MLHVMSCSSVEIIDAQDLIAALKQSFAQMRADKTGSAGDQNAALCQHELLLTAGRELRSRDGLFPNISCKPSARFADGRLWHARQVGQRATGGCACCG